MQGFVILYEDVPVVGRPCQIFGALTVPQFQYLNVFKPGRYPLRMKPMLFLMSHASVSFIIACGLNERHMRVQKISTDDFQAEKDYMYLVHKFKDCPDVVETKITF